MASGRLFFGQGPGKIPKVLPRRVLGKVSGQSYEEGDGRFWIKPHTEALPLAVGNST